jgi:hypothetical protein
VYTSPNIVRVIKSRKMRWVCHIAGMGEMRNAYEILVRKPEGKSPLERPKCGCGYKNEPLGFTKGREFLD